MFNVMNTINRTKISAGLLVIAMVITLWCGYTEQTNAAETGMPEIIVIDGADEENDQPEGETLYKFDVQTEETYNIFVEYTPLEGNGGKITRKILIDGEIPAKEFGEIEFSRIWADAVSPGEQQDIYGNDIRPVQTELPSLTGSFVRDPSGFISKPLEVELSAGSHTLTLITLSEPMDIHQIKFIPAGKLITYDVYKANTSKMNGDQAPEAIMIQAEQASAKSDRTLYPNVDRSSPDTIPYDHKLQKINTIGGVRWQRVGQWIEWDVEVPDDGFYKIALRWKQDEKMNDVSVRELSVDGEVPFEEAYDIQFGYSGGWQSSALSRSETGEPFVFFLGKGIHTIRLAAGLGEYAAITDSAQKILYELNQIYRQIVKITGPVPDQFRDYQFEKTIPETLVSMTEINNRLRELESEVTVLTKGGGQSTAVISRLIYLIDEMTGDVETIAYRLADFQGVISGLGAWINQIKAQPLELDYLILSAPDTSLPRAEASVFQVALHYIKQFFASFIIDYAEIGTTDVNTSESITVWIGSGVGTTAGRDQSQLIRQLLSEKFTPSYGISAKLQLVSMGSLLPATLAGIGPDVALQQNQGDPLNFALRNAVYDLSLFDDHKSVLERFYPSAVEPFSLDEHFYALPETQSFPMLFYRKDILSELGIDEGMLDTWDSIFLAVLPKIQKSYLQFGILPNINSYATFLYQMGGSFYSEDLQQSSVASAEGIAAFEKFTGIYTEYKQSLAFDFANRFRTGEMPIAINDFTVYNQLSVFAPELKGLWGMKPVPGTPGTDGSLDRSVSSTVSGCILMSNSDKKDDAWTFMKWWTDVDTQSVYGRELESIMGDAAR
ncbi:MAG: extracellular solute-binding protein, partial [Saccharofermentanales bacterium]